MSLNQDSLAIALAAKGITYERDEHTAADQRMAWRNPQGEIFGRFTAYEGWQELRRLDQPFAYEQFKSHVLWHGWHEEAFKLFCEIVERLATGGIAEQAPPDNH